jgi:hypothetical protein
MRPLALDKIGELRWNPPMPEIIMINIDDASHAD